MDAPGIREQIIRSGFITTEDACKLIGRCYDHNSNGRLKANGITYVGIPCRGGMRYMWKEEELKKLITEPKPIPVGGESNFGKIIKRIAELERRVSELETFKAQFNN